MKIGCERKVSLNITCLISLMIAVKNGIPHTDPNAQITVMLLLLRQKTKLTTREGHNIITSQTFQLVPVALVETTQVRETRCNLLLLPFIMSSHSHPTTHRTTQHGWGTIATKNTISSQMENYAVISFSQEFPAVLKFQMRYNLAITGKPIKKT